MVKGFLSQNQVPFDLRILVDERVQEERAQLKSTRAPVVLVGEEEVEGYDPGSLFDALKRGGYIGPDAAPAPSSAQTLTLSLDRPIEEGLIVASFVGDAVNFLHRGGSYLGPDLAHSSVWSMGCPIAVAASTSGGSIAVVNHESGTVTFLSMGDGSYLHGDHDRSTKLAGSFPISVTAHPRRPVFYVSNLESGSVTVFDALAGDYINGTFERSTHRVAGPPNTLVLEPETDTLYVRVRQGGVTMLDAATMRPKLGDMDASTFPVGHGRDLALSGDGKRILVPESLQSPDGLGIYDSETGDTIRGAPMGNASETSPIPFSIATHPKRDIVYVACFGTNVVEFHDSHTGEYLHANVERSSFPVGSGARAMLVDMMDETLYISCFDENAVIALDAVTGAEKRMDRGASTIATTPGPRGLAIAS